MDNLSLWMSVKTEPALPRGSLHCLSHWFCQSCTEQVQATRPTTSTQPMFISVLAPCICIWSLPWSRDSSSMQWGYLLTPPLAVHSRLQSCHEHILPQIILNLYFSIIAVPSCLSQSHQGKKILTMYLSTPPNNVVYLNLVHCMENKISYNPENILVNLLCSSSSTIISLWQCGD